MKTFKEDFQGRSMPKGRKEQRAVFVHLERMLSYLRKGRLRRKAVEKI
jgi:hypothetical protein